MATMEAPTLGVGPSEDEVRVRGVDVESGHVSVSCLDLSDGYLSARTYHRRDQQRAHRRLWAV